MTSARKTTPLHRSWNAWRPRLLLLLAAVFLLALLICLCFGIVTASFAILAPIDRKNIGLWGTELSHLATCISPIVLFLSAAAIWSQLVASGESSLFQERVARRDQFWQASILNSDLLLSMRLHWRDHFLPEHDDIYQSDVRKFKSYALAKQKYMYLIFHHHLKDEFEGSSKKWLEELVGYEEFRHVHLAHKKYYEEFTGIVDAAISSFHGTVVWMCDEGQAPRAPTEDTD